MNCDPIARWYWLLEHLAFGSALQRARCRYLAELAAARNVLALGDGDGRALLALLQMCPQAQVDYLDQSAQMLRLAKERVARAGWSHRVIFLQADARTHRFTGVYDAVVSHFFFDCFDVGDAAAIIDRVSASTSANAVWLVSEFRESARWMRGVVRVLYFFFRMTTGLRTSAVANYAAHLRSVGFRRVEQTQSCGGLLAAELWHREK